jgi:integrase/recombinase XerD
VTVYPHQRNDALWTVLHESVKASRKLASSTKAVYLRNLDEFATDMGTSPASWTMPRMQTYYDRLCEQKKPQSVKGMINAIRFAIRRYNEGAHSPIDDFTRFELAPPKQKADREPISEGEAQALLETCNTKTPIDLRDFAMIVSMIETGWREISVVNVLWESIKEIEPGLTITEVRSKGVDLLPVPLTPTVLLGFRPWRKWCSSQHITTGPVFRSLVVRGKELQIGTKPMTEQAIYNIITKRGKEAGISRHIHPHLTRHAFMTWRSSAQVPPNVIMSVTGHSIPGFSSSAKGYINLRPLWREAMLTTPKWLVAVVEKFSRST